MMLRSYTNEFKYNLRDQRDISEIIDILTSEDMENTPLESRMWFRMDFTTKELDLHGEIPAE